MVGSPRDALVATAMAQVPFVGDKMKEEDIYGAIRSAHDGHGVALPRWDDLDVSTRMAFIEAIAQAHSEGYAKGLEDGARVAETTIYNERPGNKAIAAAIRALKGNDNG